MYEAFINILDVPTHIFTWGHWIEESFSKKEIVLCITGNPGLAGYYTEFMRTVHEKLGQDVPVWIIGKYYTLTIRHCNSIHPVVFTFSLHKRMPDTMNREIAAEKCPRWKATSNFTI